MANRSLIIHVVQHLSRGGLETLTLDMLRFASSNQQVLLVSLEGDADTAFAQWPKLKTYADQLIFLNKPKGYSPKTLYQLYKLFRIMQPNVVHTHHIGPLLYGAIAARCAKVKHKIHTEHDGWHLSNPKHRRLQKLALNIAKPLLIADAKGVKSQIEQHLGKQNIQVINNGIDCEYFTAGAKQLARRAYNLPRNAKLIGAAGRLEQVKGHDILIAATALLPEDIELAIAGTGSEQDRLTAQVRELGLAHRVHFLGLVNNMASFYQGLDLFCLPSRNEGFPLSTLEAQSCDIVTIASNVGATCETICPKTGALFEANNPQALARLALAMLNHPQRASSPREFVSRHFDIRKMVQTYAELTLEKSA